MFGVRMFVASSRFVGGPAVRSMQQPVRNIVMWGGAGGSRGDSLIVPQHGNYKFLTSTPEAEDVSDEVVIGETVEEIPFIPTKQHRVKAKHSKRLPRFEITRKPSPHTAPSPALFAVVHVAGKQYKVSVGDTIVLNRIQADVGRSIALKKVLLVGGRDWTKIGTPLVDDKTVAVSATVTEHFRGAKVQVFKKKRRKGYAKRHGHRQESTKLKILEISSQN